MSRSLVRGRLVALAVLIPLTLTDCDPFTPRAAPAAGGVGAEADSWITVTEGQRQPDPEPEMPAPAPEHKPELPHLPVLEATLPSTSSSAVGSVWGGA